MSEEIYPSVLQLLSELLDKLNVRSRRAKSSLGGLSFDAEMFEVKREYEQLIEVYSFFRNRGLLPREERKP